MVSKHHSTREKWNKLLPQNRSPEVHYSLLIMVAVLVMLDRLDKRLGRLRQRFPFQFLLEQPPFHGFMFLHRLPEIKPRWVFIYAFLGQAERSGANTDSIRGSRSRKAWVARPAVGPMPPLLFSPWWPSRVFLHPMLLLM
jgi:hypothetical protein